MAFKNLFDRFANVRKMAASSIKNCRISSTSTPISHSTRFWNPNRNGNGSTVPRFLHRIAVQQPDTRTHPFVDGLMENLKLRNVGRGLNVDGLIKPLESHEDKMGQDPIEKMWIESVRKLLKFQQLENMKMKLRDIKENWIKYERFVEMCSQDFGKEEGLVIAKNLDESGAVIVLGNMVFLHPHQVVKTMQELIPAPKAVCPNNNLKELKELEKQKAMIDKKADELVRRELWCGLAFMVIQTAGFMRLTFWELTWDVMEPICFYVTSMYFMAGYAFFLRTSIEPSFEGFFQSRLDSKKKKLMKLKNFDIGRYNELKKVCSPHDMPPFDPLPFNPLLFKHGGNNGCAYQ